MDLKVVKLLSKVYAFYEEEGHAIMDCPFVFYDLVENDSLMILLHWNPRVIFVHVPSETRWPK